MPTAHEHRVIIVAPVARVAAVVAYLQANVDATTDPNLGPPLNATGLAADPVTHRWSNGAYLDWQCRLLLSRLCQLAGTAAPTLGQWNGWTGAQKRSWLASVRAGVLSGYGVGVFLAQNDGPWDDPQAVLTALGLRTIGPAQAGRL